MNNDIASRIAIIEEKIEKACRHSGRKRDEIKLMAVTKFRSLAEVEEAFKAGIRLFGENRVLEGIEKFSKIREKLKEPAKGLESDKAELHLIGSLQRNKAKKAAAFYNCIQSVDRESLIDELGTLTQNAKYPLIIMLEYHTGEASKAGFPDQDSVFKAAEKVLSFPGLYPAGLMTMAPFTDDTAAIRSSFRKLAALRDELIKRFGSGNGKSTIDEKWSILSMGMTNDFEIAIEEGANLIRIGTAIFGDSPL